MLYVNVTFKPHRDVLAQHWANEEVKIFRVIGTATLHGCGKPVDNISQAAFLAKLHGRD